MIIIAEETITEPINREAWPDCKNMEDIARFMKRNYLEDDVSIYDLLASFGTPQVKFEIVE